jgi:hypothetical protein
VELLQEHPIPIHHPGHGVTTRFRSSITRAQFAA